MLGEALDEARERIKALEAQVADLGLREGIQHARADGWQRKAEIAQESADKLVSMQHRLDAAIDRERQAIARAERAEMQRQDAQETCATLRAQLAAEKGRTLSGDAEAELTRLRTFAGDVAEALGYPRELASDLSYVAAAVGGLYRDRNGRLHEIARLGEALVRPTPDGWPEGWTPDETPGRVGGDGPADRHGRKPFGRAYNSLAGVRPEMQLPLCDTEAEALELLRRMAWGLAGRPLAASEPEPAPSESLPAEAPAASFVESAMPYREPRWLAAVRGRLGAEPDEDVAWGAGPYVSTAHVRKERERLGIAAFDGTAPKSATEEPHAPSAVGADDDLSRLDDAELEAQYRAATNQRFFRGWNRAKREEQLRAALAERGAA